MIISEQLHKIADELTPNATIEKAINRLLLLNKEIEVQQETNLIHWNCFIALEEDIYRLSRYIEFTSDNFSTYSIEIVQIYLAASSEVDVVAKQLSKKIEPGSSPKSITEYRKIINRGIPSLKTDKVALPRYGLELTPWSEFVNGKSPLWWKMYNKVKHERQDYFKHANLANVLKAMAGLFLLILHYYKGETGCERIEPPPSIFTPPDDIARVCPSAGGRMAMFYGA